MEIILTGHVRLRNLFYKSFLHPKSYMESKPHSTKVDMYIINKVREMREGSEMTQAALSQALNMADSFVSNVESLKRRDKYNVNHLNQLAKIFKCSPREFLPEKPL